MELGSIHRDEQSARRAVATLIRAGIEPERVKLISPRPPRLSDPPMPPPRAQWKGCLRDVTGGLIFGAAVGVLACVILTVLDATFVAANTTAAYAWIAGTSTLAGLAVALLIHWRYLEEAKLTVPRPRPRTTARGWAVVVHARDVEQRALAARALRASHSSSHGPVAA